jgi:type I restriction enzyme S subunit
MSAVVEAREPSATYLSALQPPLVQHFELMATAPGGVARLRELIFRLAAAGRLVQCGEALQSVRLDEVAEFVMGQAPPSAECNTTGQGAVFVKTGEFGSLYPEVREWTTRPLKFAKQGDVLICVVGATVGKLNLAIDCAIGRSVAAIRPTKSVDTKYLYYSLIPFTLDLRRRSRGSAQGVIGKAELGSVTIRVPSLAEQSRIVARVEELMRLCDSLEAKGQLEAAQHAQLVQTLLGALTASTTPEELADNWQRVATHFDLLLDRPEAIYALEQTILQLAVRGLLVPQDPKDEPAGELLKKIRSEKDQLIAEGRIKRDKPMEPVAIEDVPFVLPKGWSWVRFDELINPLKPIAYGVLVPGPDVETGVPFVRIADLSIDNPAPMPEKSIGRDIDSQFQRTRLEGGEILMGVVGSIGKLGVAPPTWAGANIARAICRIVPADSGLREFVLFLLQTEFMQQSFVGDTRTLAQPTLNVGLIRQALTPVPPPAEQARIVARVGLLRRHCAELRQRLAARQTTQAHLAEALIAEVA